MSLGAFSATAQSAAISGSFSAIFCALRNATRNLMSSSAGIVERCGVVPGCTLWRPCGEAAGAPFISGINGKFFPPGVAAGPGSGTSAAAAPALSPPPGDGAGLGDCAIAASGARNRARRILFIGAIRGR